MLTPAKIVAFAPINTLSPMLTRPTLYSSTKYSWHNIVALYPITQLLPSVISSGYKISGVALNAKAVSLPTFIFKAFRYNQCFHLRLGKYLLISMIITFLHTFIKRIVRYIFHNGFAPETFFIFNALKINTSFNSSYGNNL